MDRSSPSPYGDAQLFTFWWLHLHVPPGPPALPILELIRLSVRSSLWKSHFRCPGECWWWTLQASTWWFVPAASQHQKAKNPNTWPRVKGWDRSLLLWGPGPRKGNSSQRTVITSSSWGQPRFLFCVVLFSFPNHWQGIPGHLHYLTFWHWNLKVKFRLISGGISCRGDMEKKVKINHLPLGTVGVPKLKGIFEKILLSAQNLNPNLRFRGLHS